MTDERAEAAAKILRWRHDPIAFVHEVFAATPDAWQADALASLRPHTVNRLCMKACAGPGKSTVLSWIGWWMLTCFAEPGEHPKGAAVSITGDNLHDNLWPELQKWRLRSPYLQIAFEWNSDRIYAKDHPGTWFLSARSFPKTADEQELGRTLSGLHSRFAFVLLDEAGDMNASLGKTAEQAMSNCDTGVIAMAGNTTSLSGLLYAAAVLDAAKWKVITITGDPDDAKRSPRVDVTWAREMIAKYGRENPWVMAFVLGQFPPTSINALIGYEEVRACIERVLDLHAVDGQSRLIGVDPARFGDDPTAIIERQGRCVFDPFLMRGARTDEIAGRVAYLNRENPADAIFVDSTGGYGAGVVDALRDTNLRVIEVNFSSKPNDDGYYNKRAEMWWDMCQYLKSGAKLPNHPDLPRELCEPTYTYKQSKILLEDKDQLKKRLGWSPNIADALATTFAQPIVRNQRALHPVDQPKYDPLARVRKPYNALGRLGR